MLRKRLHRLAFPVRGRAHVEDDPFPAHAFDDARVSRADHPMGDALDAEVQRLRDARRLARLARVARQVKARSPRGFEGGALRRRWVAGFVSGEVEADDATSRECAGDPRELHVLVRRVIAHRSHDRDRRDRAGLQTAKHRFDDSVNG